VANVKITELFATTSPASTDVLVVVDLPADVTKKVTIADLLENAGNGSQTAPAFAFSSDSNTGIFLDAADKLGISTNGVGRIYIAADGKVGIGTSAPSEVLDVVGNAEISGTLDVTGATSFDGNLTVQGNLTVNGTTTTIDSTTLVVEDKNIELGVVATPTDGTADGGGITLKGATDKTIRWTNSTGYWNFGQPVNVPAGTENGPGLILDNQTAGIYSPATDELGIVTDGAERIRIDLRGNVGIGTDNPTELLHLSGSAPTIEFEHTSLNSDFAIRAGSIFEIRRNSDSTRYIVVDPSENAVGIGTANPVSKLHVDGGITVKDNEDVNTSLGDLSITVDKLGNSSTKSIKFLNGNSEKLRIDGNGNVGIGTSSPVSTLHLHNASTDGFDALRFTNTDTGVTATDGFVIGLNDSEDGKIWNYDNRSIQFGVDNELHGTLRQDGRWCLGPDQASGSTTLNVFIASGSSAQFRADSDPGIELKDDSDSSIVEIRHDSAQMVIDLDLTNQVTGESFVIKRDGTSANETELFRIDSSGNVGLGTDTPDEKLHVNGGHIVIGQSSGATTNIRNYVKFGREDNPKAAIGFINNDSNGRGDIIFMNDSVGDGTTFSNTDEVMRIDFNGNVGIGTDAPALELDVSGTVRASTGVLFGTDTADANTLDDYEEGSWTPTYTGSTSDPTVTYDQQGGSYVRIGKLVRCEGRLRTDAASGGSGNLRLSGLPFAAMNEQNARGSFFPTHTLNWASNVPTQGRVKNNASYVELARMTSTSVSADMVTSDLDNGLNKNDIHFAIIYRAKV